jgi:hypothetical protein
LATGKFLHPGLRDVVVSVGSRGRSFNVDGSAIPSIFLYHGDDRPTPNLSSEPFPDITVIAQQQTSDTDNEDSEPQLRVRGNEPT